MKKKKDFKSLKSNQVNATFFKSLSSEQFCSKGM